MIREAEEETPSYLKDEQTIKKIEEKQKKGGQIKKEIHEFESIKIEADNLFKQKKLQLAVDKYQILINKLENLSQEELSKFSQIYFKCKNLNIRFGEFGSNIYKFKRIQYSFYLFK